MRLIDVDELLKQVKAIHNAVDTSEINQAYDTGFHSATSQIMGLIEYMPTIDAEPVVRCKDCKHSRIAFFGERYCGRDKTVELGELKDDDFCSYGERKN